MPVWPHFSARGIMCMRRKFRGSMSLISQSLKHERAHTHIERIYSFHKQNEKNSQQENIHKFNNRFICHAQSFTFVLCIVGVEWISFFFGFVVALRFIWLAIRLRSHREHTLAHAPYRFVLEKAINGQSEQYKPFLLIMIAVRSSADWLGGWLAGHYFIILSAAGSRFICWL